MKAPRLLLAIPLLSCSLFAAEPNQFNVLFFSVGSGDRQEWRSQENQGITEQILTAHTRIRHSSRSPRHRIEPQASAIGIGRRRNVGGSCSSTLATGLCMEALKGGLLKRRPPGGRADEDGDSMENAQETGWLQATQFVCPKWHLVMGDSRSSNLLDWVL